ncbi:MAG: hypothetical protein WAN34_08600 [Acidimicrobiia bacterium]
MFYNWLRYLHVASALAFIGIHGTSMVVLYVVRGETDRKRIEALMGFSAKTVLPMYISLAAVAGTGLWMGFEVTGWFSRAWYWVALGLLILITALMFLVARPFGERILAACGIRPSGVPRRSDEELRQILHSQRTNVITGIGIVGLGLILYLMLFKPSF